MAAKRSKSKPATPWYVYVLYSVSTGRLYTGVSTDPHARVKKHNEGKGAKNTRYGKPWLLVRIEKVRGRSEALKREYVIKQLSHQAKLVLAGLAA
jgi:putative endonuclease